MLDSLALRMLVYSKLAISLPPLSTVLDLYVSSTLSISCLPCDAPNSDKAAVLVGSAPAVMRLLTFSDGDTV